MGTFNDTLQASVARAIDKKGKKSERMNAVVLDARIQELEGTLLAYLDQMSVGGIKQL